VFQLTKVWVDPGPGIDTMEIRYTWCAHGEEPRWEGEEYAEIMSVVPDTSPRIRTAALEIPRYVSGQDSYLLHYRFGQGGEHIGGYSPVMTDEIVAREVEYVDDKGDLTEVRVLWSVGGGGAPNWSQARLEGLSLPATGPTGPDAEGEGLADDAIYELIQTVPLPRRYVAKVWGPRRETVEYVYQLLRTNSPLPEDDFERWDDNRGEKFYVTLD
jgi:hypothetical protein